MYLSGMWLGVAPRTDIKKKFLKDSNLCTQSKITILGSIVNIIK